MSEPKSATQMVAEAKGRVENLIPEQVAAEVEGGDAIFIDIREDDEQRQQHRPLRGVVGAGFGGGRGGGGRGLAVRAPYTPHR